MRMRSSGKFRNGVLATVSSYSGFIGIIASINRGFTAHQQLCLTSTALSGPARFQRVRT